MKVSRNVPTQPGLTAAHAVYAEHGVDEFRDWAEKRNYFDDTVIRATALAKILPGVPDTPMGRAWKDAMSQALALTEADDYRDYDDIDAEDWERTVTGSINELADTVEAASPLLGDVAVSIRRQGDLGSLRHLGDMDVRRAEVTSEGILIRRYSYDEEHDTSAVVPWSHMEHLVDDLHDRVVALVEALRMETPEAAREASRGASRTPTAYALK